LIFFTSEGGEESGTIIKFFESFLKRKTRSCPEKSPQSDESECSVRLMVSKKSGMLEDRLDKVLPDWEENDRRE
jgi:hypothetical protein